MQHYYIPCTQQERHQGSSKRPVSSHTLFRRSLELSQGQSVELCGKVAQPTSWSALHAEPQSQTPSLEESSSPSQHDETSPRTPSSLASDDVCSIEQDGSQRANAGAHDLISGHSNGYSFLNGDALPSRPKATDQSGSQEGHQQRQYAAHPAVITETAVRSRLARPAPHVNDGLPSATRVSVKKAAPVVTLNSRYHARRRPCATSTGVAPPKLKRDTDCTDAIVKLIVCFSTKLVHAIWTKSSNTTTPRSSGAFHGTGVLPLRVFIQETLRRSKTSYSTLQVALFYLILLKPYVDQHHGNRDAHASSGRALQCGRRMFLTALILASKYLQDRNYSSRAWSKISGLPINEINENERRYLNLIQFDLHMKKETFENWSKIVLTLCKAGEGSMNSDLAQESSKAYVDASDNVSIASDDEARSGSDQWWMHQLGLLSADMVQDTTKTEAFLASLTKNRSVSNLEPEELLASLDTPPSSPDSASDVVADNATCKPSSEVSMGFGGQKYVDFSSSPAPSVSGPRRPHLPNLPTPQTTPRFTRTLPMPRGMCQTKSRCRESSRALLGLDRQPVNIANLETCPPPQPRARGHKGTGLCAARESSVLATSSYPSGFTSSPESIISDAASSVPRSRSSSMSSNSSAWWSSASQQWVDESSGRTQGLRKENVQTTSARPRLEATAPSSYSFYHGTQPLSQTAQYSQVYGRESADGLSSDMIASSISQGPHASDDGDMVAILASLTDRQASSATVCPAVTPTAGEPVLAEGKARSHKRDRSSISEDVLHYRVRNLLWDEPSSIEVIDSAESTQPEVKQLQYPVKEWACLKKPVSNGLHTKRFAMCHEVGSYSTDLASQYLRDDIAMVN